MITDIDGRSLGSWYFSSRSRIFYSVASLIPSSFISFSNWIVVLLLILVSGAADIAAAVGLGAICYAGLAGAATAVGFANYYSASCAHSAFSSFMASTFFSTFFL